MRFGLALGILGLLGASVAVQGQSLDDPKAREMIEPLYGLLNIATRGDVSATQKRILTPDYESCSGYLGGKKTRLQPCWLVHQELFRSYLLERA